MNPGLLSTYLPHGNLLCLKHFTENLYLRHDHFRFLDSWAILNLITTNLQSLCFSFVQHLSNSLTQILTDWLFSITK